MELNDSRVGGSVIVVSGGRQQRVGGPLPGAAIIANFLAQYRDTPSRPQPFGGRGGELQRLDEWLRTPQQPYLLLAARPGEGKSALLSRWCERLTAGESGDQFRIVFVPVSIRFEFNRQETVLRAIATRLAAIHDEPAFGESADDWRDLIGELMLREPPPGIRVLVILDGLDEAAGWRAAPSLFPNPPHDGVKLLVSARLTATHPSADDWMRDLGWSQAPAMVLQPLTEQGVRDAAVQMGPQLQALADDPATVTRLHQISVGDPLVVGLYLGDLWDNPLPAAKTALDWLEEADPGLDGFIDRWWTDQERLWGRPAALNSRRVFDLLACALGPLERRDLLEVARRSQPLTGDDLDAALAALDRLVIATSPHVYAVAHPRLLERRLTRLAQDGDLESLERSYIEWAREWVQRADTAWRPYVVRHYGQHLQRAHAPPDQMLDLLRPAWRSAWLMVTDDITGSIDDIDRVHSAASKADTAALAARERPPWPVVRIWSTCLRAEASATYDLVNGVLARVLVQRGLWSERRALARCARVDSPRERAEYLRALAPVLSRDGARLAAQLVRTLGDAEPDGAAAAVVARLVSHGELLTAQEVIADLESPAARAAGVVATFPALSEAERLEALRRLDRDGVSARLTELAACIDTGLARLAFGDPPWRYLERLLRGAERWWPADAALDELDAIHRAYAVGSLAGWMTPAEREHQVSRCLDELAAYGSEANVDDALASLAPYLQGAAWHRARAIARDLLRDEPGYEYLAYVWLLPYAPPGAAAALLKDLVTSIRDMLGWLGPGEVSEALPTLAAQGAAAAVLDAVAELGERDWEKDRYLAAVAPHLDLPEVYRALEIAADTRRQTRPDALMALLARQAECGDADAALAASAGSNDPDEMRTALAVLRVAAGRQSFSEAVTSLVAIQDRSLRVAAATLAARLSPPAGADLVNVTASLGDPIGNTDVLPMEMFAGVSSEIRNGWWRDAEALMTVSYMIHRGLHPRKNQIMVEQFRRFAEARGVQPALDLGRSYCTETFDQPLIWAAVAVASQLEPGMDIDRDELVSLASGQAAVVMAATLRLLPPGERGEALAVAIDTFGGRKADRAVRVELKAGSVALLLAAIPEELYATAANALVPDTLLDGHSRFSLPTWAGHMADLCPSLDQRRLRRLLATSQMLGSDARSELRAAIAVRLAALGEVEASLQCAGALDGRHAGAALAQIAEIVPPETIPSLIEKVRSWVDYACYRRQLALATAALGRRVVELPPPVLSRLLDRWHSEAPKRGEVLVDLLVYGPALLALGGGGSAGDLVDRLERL